MSCLNKTSILCQAVPEKALTWLGDFIDISELKTINSAIGQYTVLRNRHHECQSRLWEPSRHSVESDKALNPRPSPTPAALSPLLTLILVSLAAICNPSIPASSQSLASPVSHTQGRVCILSCPLSTSPHSYSYQNDAYPVVAAWRFRQQWDAKEFVPGVQLNRKDSVSSPLSQASVHVQRMVR